MTSIPKELLDSNSCYENAEEIATTGEISGSLIDKDEKFGNCSFLVEVKEEDKDMTWAAAMENRIISTSVIKEEPEWDHYETKFSADSLLGEQDKTQPKLIKLESELIEKTEECLDFSNQILSPTLDGFNSPKQLEVPKKTETSKTVSQSKKRIAVVFDESQIKSEEPDLKEELKQNQIIISSVGTSTSQGKPDEYTKHKCHICYYQAQRRGHLNRHLRIHKDPEKLDTFKCDKCDFETILKSSLTKHLLRHRKKIDFFICDKCEYKTVNKSNLNRHILRHKDMEEVNTFKCIQCDYETIEKQNLNRHLLRHENLKKADFFKCDQCEFQALQKVNLKKHLLRHKNLEEVDSFKCNQCDYKTIEKGNLTRHQLRHKDPKDVNTFKCYKCDFKTIYKFHLKRHYRCH